MIYKIDKIHYSFLLILNPENLVILSTALTHD
jgi:hypothetical protein